MFEKKVTIEITIPLRFEYEPAEKGFYHYQTIPATISGLDWKDKDVQQEVIKALYDPGLHDELLEYAEEKIRIERDEMKLAAAGY